MLTKSLYIYALYKCIFGNHSSTSNFREVRLEAVLFQEQKKEEKIRKALALNL